MSFVEKESEQIEDIENVQNGSKKVKENLIILNSNSQSNSEDEKLKNESNKMEDIDPDKKKDKGTKKVDGNMVLDNTIIQTNCNVKKSQVESNEIVDVEWKKDKGKKEVEENIIQTSIQTNFNEIKSEKESDQSRSHTDFKEGEKLRKQSEENEETLNIQKNSKKVSEKMSNETEEIIHDQEEDKGKKVEENMIIRCTNSQSNFKEMQQGRESDKVENVVIDSPNIPTNSSDVNSEGGISQTNVINTDQIGKGKRTTGNTEANEEETVESVSIIEQIEHCNSSLETTTSINSGHTAHSDIELSKEDKCENKEIIDQSASTNAESPQDVEVLIGDNNLTAEELQMFYKNLRLKNNSISEPERKALSQKVCLKDGSWKDVISVCWYNHKWLYICHACGGATFHLEKLDNHISDKHHDNNLKFTEDSENKFEVKISQGIYGKRLISGNLTRDKLQSVQCFNSYFRKKTMHFNEPLVGLEYVIQLFKRGVFEYEFVCLLCDVKGSFESILAHLVSVEHCWTFLAKFFPTAEDKLNTLKDKEVINKEQHDKLIVHLAGKVEYYYGRFKPLSVEEDKFDGIKWVVFHLIESQGIHMRETSERDFADCVDVNHLENDDCTVGWINRKIQMSQKGGALVHVQIPTYYEAFLTSTQSAVKKSLTYKEIQKEINNEHKKMENNIHKDNESAKIWIRQTGNSEWRFPGKKYKKLVIQNPKDLFRNEMFSNTNEIRARQNESSKSNEPRNKKGKTSRKHNRFKSIIPFKKNFSIYDIFDTLPRTQLQSSLKVYLYPCYTVIPVFISLS